MKYSSPECYFFMVLTVSLSCLLPLPQTRKSSFKFLQWDLQCCYYSQSYRFLFCFQPAHPHTILLGPPSWSFWFRAMFILGLPCRLSGKEPVSMQETQVQSLGQEGHLGKGMATPSSILTWRTPRTEDPGRLQSMESQRVRHDWSNWGHMHSSIWSFCLFNW